MAKILLEIDNCRQCPHVKINSYSTDGWDRVEDWNCTKTDNKPIATSVDWWEKKTGIPNWCPLKQKENGNN